MTLSLLAAIFFERFSKARLMRDIMVGVRPACLGLVVGVCVTLSLTNYGGAGGISFPAVGIGLLDTLLLFKFKISIPKVIILSAALGLLIFGVLPRLI